MKPSSKRLKAIDLYSGVGGWGLGLRLAGIDVVGSYERWGVANETNFKNNRHQAQTVDIRRLALVDLPSGIDIVVGSPPCTQFSYSNRGGQGDLKDGLKDIVKFLSIVDYLKPKAWAMENVPRVRKIIESELAQGGALYRFRGLGIKAYVFNMADFGLPQRRMRCIAGNFDFDLLQSYSERSKRLTLGDVVKALKQDVVTDPLFGGSLRHGDLRDHVEERPLTAEEIRINRAAKETHTVYNAMSFPDRLDRPVRTVMATCTRVSRESIVIATGPAMRQYRRLTIRERASLQGFPITFQFYTDQYSHKQEMVGNAIPPAFTYYLAHALLKTSTRLVPALPEAARNLTCPSPPAKDATPNGAGGYYAPTRRFRFAIPSLQLKSGVRFEVANRIDVEPVMWGVDFYFGTSKSIISLGLDAELHSYVRKLLPRDLEKRIDGPLQGLRSFIENADVANMQRIWSHRGLGITTPFMLLDAIDVAASELVAMVASHDELARWTLGAVITSRFGFDESRQLPGLAKLARNAPLILTGLVVGSAANRYLRAWSHRVEPRPSLVA